MADNPVSRPEDEQCIANLLIRWGHARDYGDWEALAECFHSDATVHLAWMLGSANDYIARARSIAAMRQSGAHSKHVISGPWIRMRNERAFSRCHATLYIRTTIDGHWFDLQSWICFYDLLERRDGVWRIAKRTVVYEKDRLDPVGPQTIPDEFYAHMDLSSFPEAAKFTCYWHSRTGRNRVIPANIVSMYSDGERAARLAGDLWLERA